MDVLDCAGDLAGVIAISCTKKPGIDHRLHKRFRHVDLNRRPASAAALSQAAHTLSRAHRLRLRSRIASPIRSNFLLASLLPISLRIMPSQTVKT